MSAIRIRKVLVANRGEIARRILRTCHEMGIATAAAYSDADAEAPFVREADEAVRLGPAPAAESYLHAERLIRAAKRVGADALHPGYGFLSESGDFAQACEEAGLVFIGPQPDVMRTLGSKRESKQVAQRASVPIVPWYSGAEQDTAVLAKQGVELGLPVVIKASAGGGGRGMRVVRLPEDLESAIDAARREAEIAFANGELLVEKYIESPRHVEIQILGDSHGNVVHLFERECSIQRRHQKLVEESPSPALTGAMRSQMGEAAVRLAMELGYRGAGTVEFVLAPDGAFYFLEVNARLQVEHPVTECVTGLDLVREQIRIAQGAPLDFTQEDVDVAGAAIELRIYAEDPAEGFLPSSGKILDFHRGSSSARVDSGVESGDVVSPHYDGLLAKVIAWGADRTEALSVARRALRELSIQGVRTNRVFLSGVLSHPEFVAGNIDTHFLDKHTDELSPSPVTEELLRRAAVAVALMAHDRRRQNDPMPSIPSGYRNNRYRDQVLELSCQGDVHPVSYRSLGDGRFAVNVDEDSSEVTHVSTSGPEIVFDDGAGVRRKIRVIAEADRYHVHLPEADLLFREASRFPLPERETAGAACVAPMPGRVVKVHVAQGDKVAAGQPLLVLEAMKMEHTLSAGAAGTVTQILATEGQQIDADQLLIRIESHPMAPNT